MMFAINAHSRQCMPRLVEGLNSVVLRKLSSISAARAVGPRSRCLAVGINGGEGVGGRFCTTGPRRTYSSHRIAAFYAMPALPERASPLASDSTTLRHSSISTASFRLGHGFQAKVREIVEAPFVDKRRQRWFSSDQHQAKDARDLPLRLSLVVSRLAGDGNLSRRQAELQIRRGNVAVNGRVITSPQYDLNAGVRFGAPAITEDVGDALPDVRGVEESAKSGASANDHAGTADETEQGMVESQHNDVSSRITLALKGRTIVSADSIDELIDRYHAKQQQLAQASSSASVLLDGAGSTDARIRDDGTTPKVWAAHKTKGELVAHHDPLGRPTLLERLQRGGLGQHEVGGQNVTLKPIGRLDMMTEGLILLTNCGKYAREMELPSSQLHRTYRVRVHGRITPQKLERLRSGGMFRWQVPNVSGDGYQTEQQYYAPMKVQLEAPPRGRDGIFKFRTNNWMQITCREGKNRQIRNALASLGLTVTRLIRISFGDYQLHSIPSGMVIPVPHKPVQSQAHRGRKNFDQHVLPRQQQRKRKAEAERRNDAGNATAEGDKNGGVRWLQG